MIMLFEEFNLNKTLRDLRDSLKKKEIEATKASKSGKEDLVRVKQAEIKVVRDKMKLAKSKNKAARAKEREESQRT